MPLVTSPPSLLWSMVFGTALLVGILARLWLNHRQARHVFGHRNAVPPAFAQEVSLPSHQKAAAYTLAQLRLNTVELLLGGVVLIVWTYLGGLDLLQHTLFDFWQGQAWPWALSVLGTFFLLHAVFELPLQWYRTFRLEAHFGFNHTSLRLWWADWLKSTCVGLVLGAPLAVAVLWLMEHAGSAWWLWAWGAWSGFNVLLMVLYPVLIAPRFNTFTPLEHGELHDRVQQLMQTCGFTSQGLFTMDGSKRSAHANAYFTGLGPAKRVVLFDTLLQRLSAGEIVAVLAHELGHFKMRHITQRVVAMLLLSLLGFATLGWLSSQVWFYFGLGVTPQLSAPNHALALLLFVLSMPVFSVFLTPIWSSLSRRHEFQADAYAYACQHATAAELRSALIKLYQDNASTLTPDPLYARVHYSHPPASERLARLPA